MRPLLTAVVALVASAAVLGGCSSASVSGPTAAPAAEQPAPPPAADTSGAVDVCGELAAGAVPAQFLPRLPGINEDPPRVLAEAASTIREDCPQYAREADSIQFLVDSGAAATAPRGPEDAALQACVEQTGQTEDQCREQAASGGAS